MILEIWKTIFENYQISNLGRVRSIKRFDKSGHLRNEKIIKSYITKFGYMRVNLYIDGKRKNFFVHRLVAEMFIENIDNKKQVNHIDGDKLNNNVENLEWCTPSENQLHAYKKGLKFPNINNKSISKRVFQFDKNNILINKYPSVKEVQRQTGFDRSNISACCRGALKSAYGYRWRYESS